MTLPYVNEDFATLASLFAGDLVDEEEGDIALAEHLDRDQLDFSLDSLRAVDTYLSYLHANRPEQLNRDWGRVVLWGGAYLGEVVRRHAQRPLDWVDFDDFVQVFPGVKQILGDEKRLGWCAFLTPGNGGFTLPLNKILRFIYDGPADSTHYYATCEVLVPG